MSNTKRSSFTVGVKLLSGKSFSVTVQPTDTVAALKQRIFEREGIPPQRQNLLVMGKLLQPDARDLRDYNLKPGDMVYVTAGVRGQPELPPTGSAARSKPVPVVDPKEVKAALQQRLSKMSVEKKDKALAALNSCHPEVKSTGTPAPATADGKDPKDGVSTDLGKIRSETVQKLGTVEAVVRADPSAVPETGNTTRWPRASELYAVYKRKGLKGELTGMTTVGLSNPYRNTFYFAVGIGLEIVLECPTEEARLWDENGELTPASMADSWMFGIVYEIAQQCFALGLQIRQLIEQMGFLSVELAGVNLPAKYIDSDTGRCCVLLGPSGDPAVTRGFNVAVPYQQQWTMQSVLFVTARLLTFEQCQMIRKDGAEARRQLVEKFANDKSFGVSSVPVEDWKAPAPAATPITAATKPPIHPPAASAAKSVAAVASHSLVVGPTPTPTPTPTPAPAVSASSARAPDRI